MFAINVYISLLQYYKIIVWVIAFVSVILIYRHKIWSWWIRCAASFAIAAFCVTYVTPKFLQAETILFWFNPLAGSWVFTGNQEKFVIGDLGGRPVSIPRDFARFVEYDGDPGFMKKREVPVPKRTYQSRLRSFGYEVRYPDMAGRSRETAQEKEYETIYNTMWLRVGLSSGEDYHPREEKDDHLDGYLKMALQPRGENTLYVIFEHQKLHETMYGLEAHVPVRARYSGRKFVPIDEMRKKVKNDYFDRNYYVLRREDGHIKTFINCGNGPYESANCTQKFRLRSPMRAYVDISYRRGLLPYWQEIQEKVTAQLLGFQVDSGI